MTSLPPSSLEPPPGPPAERLLPAEQVSSLSPEESLALGFADYSLSRLAHRLLGLLYGQGESAAA
jgi:hypothetical protein